VTATKMADDSLIDADEAAAYLGMSPMVLRQ
jgi:hypothetical protein